MKSIEKQDIVVKDLSKSFGEKRVLDSFSAVFPAGKVSCIMGQSGCGKSTLLNIILGLLKPDGGEITGLPSRISALFQEDRLCEEFSARSNLRIAASKSLGPADIDSALADLGLGSELLTPVRELSGGMKRRVALARAMLAEGDLIVMDEPFRGLDDATRSLAAGFVLRRLYGRTLIVVTHDPADLPLLDAVQVIKMTPAGADGSVER